MRVVVRSNAAPLCGESLTPSQGLVDVRDYQLPAQAYAYMVIISSIFFIFFEGGCDREEGVLGLSCVLPAL